jgi:hypothetical protein
VPQQPRRRRPAPLHQAMVEHTRARITQAARPWSGRPLGSAPERQPLHRHPAVDDTGAPRGRGARRSRAARTRRRTACPAEVRAVQQGDRQSRSARRAARRSPHTGRAGADDDQVPDRAGPRHQLRAAGGGSPGRSGSVPQRPSTVRGLSTGVRSEDARASGHRLPHAVRRRRTATSPARCRRGCCRGAVCSSGPPCEVQPAPIDLVDPGVLRQPTCGSRDVAAERAPVSLAPQFADAIAASGDRRTCASQV